MEDAFIQIHDLKKIYQMGDTQVHALDGVSMDIPQGSFTTLMGPSGSGKSTMLYLIGGLDTPTSGSINVDGELVEKMDENALAGFRRNKLGFIFQSFNLISTMTAEDNVGFPCVFRVSNARNGWRGLKRSSNRLGWKTASVISPQNFPAVSNSAWLWHAR